MLATPFPCSILGNFIEHTMQQSDSTNTVFNLASDLVNHTSRHLFITGKAGTGKTTFLKYIRDTTRKNIVVVAPTGVAAINAGGVTMHSFFQLPFGPFVPGQLNRDGLNMEVTDKHSLFRNIHFAGSKRELLQELELLVIDEVSMVRCDMLDAIDVILRHFRKQPMIPFGGVQVVYIGDMFQLPPVVQQHEWNVLKDHYESPFFFGAHVIKESPPLYIELKKIYRQNEQQFIDILNRIRNNKPLPQDLNTLNGRFIPGFTAPEQEKYITLTTHNKKADVINEAMLQKLPGKVHVFEAEITGEFSDKALPTEMKLGLKEGAQIMFIKNDMGNDRKYYNGKIGIVKKIFKDEIFISFDNGDEPLKIEKETWKNIRYSYDKASDKINEEELGSFKQFPIRLAWAITIHKSQGLTFDRAIIDAGSSFAAGQVYVALSRCTSLDGMVLHSKIFSNAISTDPRVLEFANREANDDYLEELLKEEKYKFQCDALVKAFHWGKVIHALGEWTRLIIASKLPNVDETLNLVVSLTQKARTHGATADKFGHQLQQLFLSNDKKLIQERVDKAISYFAKAVDDEMLSVMDEHLTALQYVTKLKKYAKEVKALRSSVAQYIDRLNELQFADLSFATYQPNVIPTVVAEAKQKKAKAEKGSSSRDSLLLFREGKSIDEIAMIRQLASSTVESHLSGFIYSGELDVQALVASDKVPVIIEAIQKVGMSLGSLKARLGDHYSFAEIRAVMNHHRRLQESQKASA